MAGSVGKPYPILSDFELGKDSNRNTTDSTIHDHAGTVGFRPREGKTGNGAAADVWAIGVIAFLELQESPHPLQQTLPRVCVCVCSPLPTYSLASLPTWRSLVQENWSDTSSKMQDLEDELHARSEPSTVRAYANSLQQGVSATPVAARLLDIACAAFAKVTERPSAALLKARFPDAEELETMQHGSSSSSAIDLDSGSFDGGSSAKLSHAMTLYGEHAKNDPRIARELDSRHG